MLVEGYDEISLALDAGHAPRTILSAPELARRQMRDTSAETLTVSPMVFEKMSQRENPDGWLAMFPIPHLSLEDLKLGASPAPYHRRSDREARQSGRHPPHGRRGPRGCRVGLRSARGCLQSKRCPCLPGNHIHSPGGGNKKRPGPRLSAAAWDPCHGGHAFRRSGVYAPGAARPARGGGGNGGPGIECFLDGSRRYTRENSNDGESKFIERFDCHGIDHL